MATKGGSMPSKDRDKEKAEKGSKPEKMDRAKCIKCCQAVRDNENGLECEICECWMHAKCENIGDEAYEVLKMDNIHWYCIGCNKGVGKIMVSLSRLQSQQKTLEMELLDLRVKSKARQDKNDSDVEIMRNEIERQKNEVKDIKHSLEELVNSLHQEEEDEINVDVQETLWSKIVSKHVEKKIETVKDEMHEVQKTIIDAKKQMEEEKDKQKRKNNIIIYRHPESEVTGADARKSEDLRFCNTLCRDVLEIECKDTDIQNVIRLGKREGSKATRPLLVVFNDGVVKNAVMESLGKLAEADERFKNISITHDMTQKERDDCKRLVEEAKERQKQDTSGEWIYRVRGMPGEMRIVRLKKRVS